ncbi:hypothetical protein WA026_018023 [Henosepilachna vigintioctopunctata]|uniref:NADP-dependent oxidoreductase domain-containing protein n=1 Tax=Henosepilachna vigintioctopunctata TaxID=420089 RepID=A0AAW1UPR9_9CUCU
MANRTFTLSNGTRMPIIGYGINKFEIEQLSVKSLEVAFDSGCRNFNTAFINSDEKILGKAISHWIGNGLVERKDLFITAKLAVYFNPIKSVEKFVDLSLANLGLDYIDLYLLHLPEFCKCAEKNQCVLNQMSSLNDDDFLAIWKGMEEMVTAGKVMNIGFANVNSQKVSMVMKNAKIKPAVVQLEIHPFIPNLDQIKFCKQNGITVLGYAPLDDGNFCMKEKDTKSKNDRSFVNEEVIIRIARKHSKTPGQVILRHMMQGRIGPLSKTLNHTRIKENFDIFDFVLDKYDINELDRLNKMFNPKACQFVCKKHLHLPKYLYDL